MKNFEKYQVFAMSSALFILANNWHFIGDSRYLPRFFDFAAYVLFIFGIFQLIKNKHENA